MVITSGIVMQVGGHERLLAATATAGPAQASLAFLIGPALGLCLAYR